MRLCDQSEPITREPIYQRRGGDDAPLAAIPTWGLAHELAAFAAEGEVYEG